MADLKLPVDQLRVGIFIELNLSWMEHPFPFSSFKIKSEEQIRMIRELGLAEIQYDPKRSDSLPDIITEKSEDAREHPVSDQEEIRREKQERVERLMEQKRKMQVCEKRFMRAVTSVKGLMQNVFSRPLDTAREAETLVSEVVDSLMTDKDVALQLMSDGVSNEAVYFHSLNVMVLALMLGKEAGLPVTRMRALGLGAMFHDIGKGKIPDRLLMVEASELNKAETKLLEMHPEFGEALMAETRVFPSEALQVIRQHHELCNGKGYPDQLSSTQISDLTKIAAIANVYDNHCNHPNPHFSLTPYEALAHMYGHQRAQFDTELLSIFIKAMGIYPPGTLVELNNGVIGMVISVNYQNRLRPNILIYDSHIPKDEAIIFDMQTDPDLAIKNSIRPGSLSAEMYAYLNPRSRVIYYFDNNKTDIQDI